MTWWTYLEALTQGMATVFLFFIALPCFLMAIFFLVLAVVAFIEDLAWGPDDVK